MFILNRMEASPPLLGTSNLCSFIFVTSCSVAVCLFVCCIDNVVVVKDFTRKVVRTCRLFIKDVYVLRGGCRCRVKREVLCILWKAGGEVQLDNARSDLALSFTPWLGLFFVILTLLSWSFSGRLWPRVPPPRGSGERGGAGRGHSTVTACL